MNEFGLLPQRNFSQFVAGYSLILQLIKTSQDHIGTGLLSLVGNKVQGFTELKTL